MKNMNRVSKNCGTISYVQQKYNWSPRNRGESNETGQIFRKIFPKLIKNIKSMIEKFEELQEIVEKNPWNYTVL